MRIPSFLARKLYVKGSLRNTSHGFQWEMRNLFASATLSEVVSLEMDGRACPLERVVLHPPGGVAVRATEVSRDSPLRFDLGAEVTVEVEGDPLPVGAHKIVLGLRTKETGEIELSLEDTI